MKTAEEDKHYLLLKAQMISKCDSMGYKWAGYYANLLGIGGRNPETVLRNFFNDTNKRFNAEQMAIIYNDLDDHSHIKPFTEDEFKSRVLASVTEIGVITGKMQHCLDGDGVMTLEEIECIDVRALKAKVDELYWGVIETKEYLR